MKPKNVEKEQRKVLGEEDFYKAKLIFNVEPIPEVMMSVRIEEGLRDELRDFCRQHNIQQQHFIAEAIKEVLYRVKRELEAASPLEEARGVAQKQARGEA
jgi:hypothetical protein